MATGRFLEHRGVSPVELMAAVGILAIMVGIMAGAMAG